MFRRWFVVLLLASLVVALPPSIPNPPAEFRAEASHYCYTVSASAPRRTGIPRMIVWRTRSRTTAYAWRNYLVRYYLTVKIGYGPCR